LDSSKSKTLPLVFAQENTGAALSRPELPTVENATVLKPFPDPFAWVKDPLGQTRSTDYKDWEKHRAEMMAMIEHYEIGTKPTVDIATQVTAEFTPRPAASAPATAPAAMGPMEEETWFVGAPAGGAAGPGAAPGAARGAGGAAGRGGFGGGGFGGPGGRGGAPGDTLRVTVKVKDQSFTLTCSVNIPPNAKAPYPVLVTMGGSNLPAQAFASRGIVTVNYNYNSVTQDGRPTANDAFFKLYPEQKFSSGQSKGDTGQYSAWAWGASRVIDGFTLVKDKFPVDMSHIAVTGCSRAGKLALFAGAFDERIALTIAQESGGGGATNWRFSATEPPDPTDPTGKKLSVEGITNTDHNWFATQMFGWGGDNLAKLPEDHHMLTALVAPRALYVTGNTDYTWLSNRSLYVNSKATHKVYSALGVADRFGYCVNGQHAHCNFPASQNEDLDYFLDRFMLGKDASKYVTTVPAAFASVDADRWTAWWGTGKADLPEAKQ
jgi:hypothetical protein